MKKILIAAMLGLVSVVGNAQEISANTEQYDNGLSRILWVSAGVVAGVLVVDFLMGGAVTAPIVSMTDPVMQEARAAGAVFGEQVAAATNIRDAQARSTMVYSLLVGSGAILGGWLMDKLFISTTTQP